MNFYLLSTIASSCSVSGLVKISRKVCDACGLPIITHRPRAKIVCGFNNRELFDIDFCIFDSAIVVQNYLEGGFRGLIPADCYIQSWRPRTPDETAEAIVVSIETLPVAELQEGPGASQLPPCEKCHPEDRPLILSNFDEIASIRVPSSPKSEIFRIPGMCEVVVSEKAREFIEGNRIGSSLIKFYECKVLE